MLYEFPTTVWKVTLLHEPEYALDEDGDEEEEPIPGTDYVEARLDIDPALSAMVEAGNARFIIASEASNWDEAIEDESIGGDPMTLLVECSDPALVGRLKNDFGAIEHPEFVDSYYIDEDDEIIGGAVRRVKGVSFQRNEAGETTSEPFERLQTVFREVIEMTDLPFFVSIPVEHRDQTEIWRATHARGVTDIGSAKSAAAMIVWFELQSDLHAFMEWFGQHSDCLPLAVYK